MAINQLINEKTLIIKITFMKRSVLKPVDKKMGVVINNPISGEVRKIK